MHEYRRILALVDLDTDGLRVARRAFSLARMGDAELALLHCIAPEPELDGGYPAPSHEQAKAGYESEAMRRLRFIAAEIGADTSTLFATYGHAPHALAVHIAEWHPDLIVTSQHADCPGGRHDLLTLGRQHTGSGLTRWLKSLWPDFGRRLAC